MIRTGGAPEAILPTVQAELAEIAPDLALTSAMSMETRAAAATVRPRVLTLMLGFFAGVALFLVAVGLYGTISYVVAQRTPELGLRASPGAGRGSLLALVLRLRARTAGDPDRSDEGVESGVGRSCVNRARSWAHSTRQSPIYRKVESARAHPNS
jgi:hypothetical protein